MTLRTGPKLLDEMELFGSRVNENMVVIAPKMVAERLMAVAKKVDPGMVSPEAINLTLFYAPVLKDPVLLHYVIQAVHGYVEKATEELPKNVKSFEEKMAKLSAIQELINILYFFVNQEQFVPALILLKKDPTDYYYLLLPLLDNLGKYYQLLRAMYEEKIIPVHYYLSLYKQIIVYNDALLPFMATLHEFFTQNLREQGGVTLNIIKKIGFNKIWQSYYAHVVMFVDLAYLCYVHADIEGADKKLYLAKDLVHFARTVLPKMSEEKRIAIGLPADLSERLATIKVFELCFDLPSFWSDPIELLDYLLVAHTVDAFMEEYKAFFEKNTAFKFQRNPKLVSSVESASVDFKPILSIFKEMLKCKPHVHPEEVFNILSTLITTFTQIKNSLGAESGSSLLSTLHDLIPKIITACQHHHDWIKGACIKTNPPTSPTSKEEKPRALSYKELKKLDEQRCRRERKEKKKAEEATKKAGFESSTVELMAEPTKQPQFFVSAETPKEFQKKDPGKTSAIIPLSSVLTQTLPVKFHEEIYFDDLEEDLSEKELMVSKPATNKEKRKLKKERIKKEQESRAKEAARKTEEEERAKELLLQQPLYHARKYIVPSKNIVVNPFTRNILLAIEQKGYLAIIAGGNVRDQLLGYEPNDVDILTDCPKEELNNILAQVLHEKAKPNPDYPNRFHLSGIDIVCPDDDEKKSLKDSALENLMSRLNQYDISLNTFCADKDGNVYDFFGYISHLGAPNLFILADDLHERFRKKPGEICRVIRFAHQFDKILIPRYIEAIQENAPLISTLTWLEYQKQIMDLFLKGYAKKNLDFLLRHNIVGSLIPPLQTLTLNSGTKKWYLNQAQCIDALPKDRRLDQWPLHNIFAFLLTPLIDEYRGFYPSLDVTIKNICHDFACYFGKDELPCQDFLEDKMLAAHKQYVNYCSKVAGEKMLVESEPRALLTAFPLHGRFNKRQEEKRPRDSVSYSLYKYKTANQ